MVESGRARSGKALRWYALLRYCWHGTARGGLTRSRASSMIGLGRIFGFLWLVLSLRQKIGKLAVIDQILTVLVLFALEVVIWLPELVVIQSSIVICHLPSSISILSLSGPSFGHSLTFETLANSGNA